MVEDPDGMADQPTLLPGGASRSTSARWEGTPGYAQFTSIEPAAPGCWITLDRLGPAHGAALERLLPGLPNLIWRINPSGAHEGVARFTGHLGSQPLAAPVRLTREGRFPVFGEAAA